ncbi:alcohol dehydrogenase family protein [Ruegeria sp. HKCCD4315]|uniref:alcohol dehydrogenase family protein n=3 Tax=unclassified Ruegeria TaxID=2625375 RepID=UPI00352CEE39
MGTNTGARRVRPKNLIQDMDQMIPETMKAVVMNGHGGLDMLEYRDMPTPTPEKGEVLIKVGACGLNNTDINTRTAWYSKKVDAVLGSGAADGFDEASGDDGTWGSGSLNFPVIQGADVAGEIVAVGEGVDPARVGERVMIDPWLLSHGDWLNPENSGYFGSEADGGYAEYTKVRAANAVPVNSSLSDAELATFPCAYTTAENLVQRTAPRPGEVVVITGASGGVGSAAIQLCRLRGCKVIAIASLSKAEMLHELGAAHVIDRNTVDLEAAIRDAAGGPVDIALDVVGSPMFMALINALRQGGRYSTSGCIAGQMAEFDLRQLVYKDLQLTGATICPAGTMQRVVGMIETGALKPLLAAIYPLEDLAKAQEAFVQKTHVGNIVVTP